jgi:nucleotide-binding universal stress UspA family protein
MFASLLVGLDGSPGADAALATAIALGRRFHSTIVLAAVVDVRVLEAPLLSGTGAVGAGGAPASWPDAVASTSASTHGLGEVMSERADRLLAAGAGRVRAAGLVAQTARPLGTVDDELLELAEEAEALVVGRRGELREGGALGAHTVRVVRRAPRPVVVAGERDSAFVRPLVAYDGSETSGAALALAARYAATAEVALDVVHVSDDAAEAAALLARAEAALARRDVDVATHVAPVGGGVGPAVAAWAAAHGADMLVCGAHGGRRRSWSIGSQTEALLRATPLPTIVVR